MPTPIDSMYEEHKSLISYLTLNNEVTFVATVEANFRKSLLLACASYLETRITEVLTEIFELHSEPSQVVLSFIKNKAMARQYHTYFQWDKSNANQFFGLFGDECKKYLVDHYSKDKILQDAVTAFMKIGRLRNELVHQNFALYSLQLTVDEVYTEYKSAVPFINGIGIKIKEFIIVSQTRSSI